MIHNFKTAPEKPVLSANEVHVWRALLAQSQEVVDIVSIWLTEDEHERAARFRFDQDRNNFVVARGVLREILGRYLQRSPEILRFDYNKQGKPELAALTIKNDLSFNLSHSGGFALYAVSCDRAVGIDIELVRPEFAGEEIAERFFSATEVKVLQSLPDQLRIRAFFDCWTRKEAFIKGVGQGLSIPLDQFDVALIPGQPAALLRTQWDEAVANQWSLHALNVHPDYAATLAIEATNIKIDTWEWRSN